MKKWLILISFLALSFSFVSCQDKTTTLTNTGGTTMAPTTELTISVYLLEEKTVDGINVKAEYIEHYIKIEADTIMMHSLKLSGLEEQQGSFEQNGNTITATIGLRNYSFMLDETEGTLTYEGVENRQNVRAVYRYHEDYIPVMGTGEVAFEDELFGEDKNLYNFYNYAPSIMMMDGELYIWYCVNDYSNYIVDFIGFRKGTLGQDGKWSFTEKELVLGPTANSWDSVHTCDPSVIKGDFSYKGEQYNFLMAYLGCVTKDNSNNEVGIAVAKAPEGPWIKIDELNPIANYYESREYSNETWTWGFGQPSLVSADKAGKVLLFYTRGLATGTDTYVEYWDFSNLDSPVKLNHGVVGENGVTNNLGQKDIINNADFAYDPIRNRFYVVDDMLPRSTTEEPTFISSHVPIIYLQLNEEDTHVGETLFGEGYSWTVHDFITPDMSGFARNHNPGLITDPYGWLISPNEVPVIYTVSLLNIEGGSRVAAWKSLHSYRLYGYVSVIRE